MNQNVQKFVELLQTDAAVQEKIKTKAENYAGDQTEEAIFRDLVAPAAEEAGFQFSFEEYKEYRDYLAQGTQSLDLNEMDQVTGGSKGAYGTGVNLCIGIGIGAGYVQSEEDRGGTGGMLCFVIGAGGMSMNVCAVKGVEAYSD